MSFGFSAFPASLIPSEYDAAVDANRLEGRSASAPGDFWVVHSLKHPREKNTGHTAEHTYPSIQQRIPPEPPLSPPPPPQLLRHPVQLNALYRCCVLPGDQKDIRSPLDMCES